MLESLAVRKNENKSMKPRKMRKFSLQYRLRLAACSHANLSSEALVSSAQNLLQVEPSHFLEVGYNNPTRFGSVEMSG